MASYEPDDGHSGIDDRRGGPLAYATDYHAPVLCKAVVDGLIWNRRGIYVDGTLGGGGHTAAILDALEEEGIVYGIDQDPAAIRTTAERLHDAVDSGRLHILRGNFHEMRQMLGEAGVEQVDGILLDLGVSSYQIGTAERGFSYSAEGELDMRMNTESGFGAQELVNDWSEEAIRQVLWTLGEEPKARRIAKRIVEARPVQSTRELAEIVRGAVPQREEMKTLSRVFQAIRIAVNGELEVLERALEEAVVLVRAPGRIAVISYHSLEDRRVKRFLRYGNFEGSPNRDFYGNLVAPWRELTRHPVKPDDREKELNPRARSARLRIAERTGG